MFGQPASWHTVCRPSDLTIECSAVNSGPILAVVRIHDGLRSMGVSALRASTRSMRRPSGVTVTAGSLVGGSCRAAPGTGYAALAASPETGPYAVGVRPHGGWPGRPSGIRLDGLRRQEREVR